MWVTSDSLRRFNGPRVIQGTYTQEPKLRMLDELDVILRAYRFAMILAGRKGEILGRYLKAHLMVVAVSNAHTYIKQVPYIYKTSTLYI